jgi:trehalose 6-phosphate synthase/phosphatase
LLIVSNRLPVTVSVKASQLRVRASSGGLATGLVGPHDRARGLWFGWPGTTDLENRLYGDDLDREFEARRIVPVALDPSEVRDFYDRISSATLWPIFHDRLDRIPLGPAPWEVYERVNARFADAIAARYQLGDVIWIHDFHLLRLPGMLRERLPNARIGFFLHIPFPAADVFETLPVRRELLAGMLGADVIGFHTDRYVENFTSAVRRVIGPCDDRNGFRFNGRLVRVGAFPMGVDATSFEALARTPAVESVVRALGTTSEQLMVGVDRLDYSKGIPRRLLALERLLIDHPELRGQLRLVQVAVPSRRRVLAYRRFRREVDELVGRINGSFATPTWTPIHYIYSSIPPETLVALYRVAKVMLVTPVRDGMNLVAKEFVASRFDGDGVLILSEFAGAAQELTSAVRVNPYDIRALAGAMYTALTMDSTERRTRMQRLRDRVRTHDVHAWTSEFLGALAQ